MLLGGWRKVYTPGAAWRSAGHLTTYGPTDNPTFITTFSPLPNRKEKGHESIKNQNQLYCNCSTPQSDTNKRFKNKAYINYKKKIYYTKNCGNKKATQ